MTSPVAGGVANMRSRRDRMAMRRGDMWRDDIEFMREAYGVSPRIELWGKIPGARSAHFECWKASGGRIPGAPSAHFECRGAPSRRPVALHVRTWRSRTAPRGLSSTPNVPVERQEFFPRALSGDLTRRTERGTSASCGGRRRCDGYALAGSSTRFSATQSCGRVATTHGKPWDSEHATTQRLEVSRGLVFRH
jgi:hypothetical protein